MDGTNQTTVTEFIFLGFSAVLYLRLTLFVVFLTVYVLSLMGNSLIIFIVLTDITLQTPILQVCLRFSAGSWIGGFIAPLLPTILISRLNFCGPQKINHFFCDSDPIFKLSCSDTFLVETLGYTCTSVVILSSFLLTISSYGYIVVTIIKLSSQKAQKKTFSTCASHLTVVSIYYGTIIFAYVRPPAQHNLTIGKVISVFYCVVTPLVNPLIYTLRNKDVKIAFRKVLARKTLLLTRKLQNI
ncbi:olfactory receptor 1019-like [Suricata suricatta]|uniref:olfactory receptor 1019-like n=1 Tax=Suricata suricatta TaxID=37032 RepID=UPI001155A03A|nr:olfactory receptor 1019-like [Suricata suricatta]